jgi:hypothetical protein
MRPEEYEEYQKLYATIDHNKYLIISQAPLTMFIDIKKDFKDHQNLYHVLGMKTVDFLIVNRNSLEPLKAIELNGKSHLLSGRKNRDSEVRDIIIKLGIEFEEIIL